MEFYFSFNENCLHTACKTKSFNLIQYLISLDKDLLEATDIFILFFNNISFNFFHSGFTPIDVAAMHGNNCMVQLINIIS